MIARVRFILMCIAMIAIACAGLIACNFFGENSSQRDITQGIVDRWVDGDTLKLKDGTRVRLLLIDTPESVAPQEERNTQEGADASTWVKERFPAGMQVWLTYDEERTDKYDRTLAYVWDTDPTEHTTDSAFIREHMLNAVILASGNATVLQVKPNGAAYIDLFKQIERESG